MSSALEKSSSNNESTISLFTTMSSCSFMRVSPLITSRGWLRLCSARDFLPELLVVVLELFEALELLIEIHPDVRDDVPVVVWVHRVVLHDDTEDSTHELMMARASGKGER